jgi:hypothetical protein
MVIRVQLWLEHQHTMSIKSPGKILIHLHHNTHTPEQESNLLPAASPLLPPVVDQRVALERGNLEMLVQQRTYIIMNP